MMKYCSKVEAYLIYEIDVDNDWIRLIYLDQMEQFPITRRMDEGSLYLNLKTDIQFEIERLIAAITYMKKEHRGISKLNQMNKAAELLNISYGELQAKISRGELTEEEQEEK
ncbi:MAG: hypothetical protein IJ526_00485 [Lachnospiraceae bacterium]|nr:hypothetical protein [Lachnospiraceae bacterium]